jgi:hypothetical protein
LPDTVSPLTPAWWQHTSRPRSEVANLRAGLALSVAWGTVIVVAIVGLVTFLGSPGVAAVAVVACAMVLAVVGLVVRRRPWGNWLSLIALAMVVALGIASPDARVDVLVMGTYSVAFFAVFLSSRPWGIVWIGVGVLVMLVVVGRSDLRVDVGTLSIDVGMVAVLQMVVAGGWLWWAWHAALDGAARRDALAAEQEQVIAEATALQERTRAWREAITRTHETILNDLRYVLRTPALDRARLREQLLTTRDRRAQPPVISDVPAPGLRARLAAEFPGTLEMHDRTGTPAEPWTDEVEPILVEIVRNIARHTDAGRIDVTIEDRHGVRRITVRDDGTSGSPLGETPGIGRGFVVEEALVSRGARLEESPHLALITLPSEAAAPTSAGRVLLLLLSIALVSSALGGSPQFLLLLAGSSLTYLPVAAAACALTALSVVTVLRRRSVGAGVVTVGAGLAAVVSWGLVAAQPACGATPLALTTINLSLNAFFAILLWARNRWAWLLVLPALFGVLALRVLPGVSCPIESIDVLLSSAVLMPVLISLSWLSARSAARWELQDRERWETEITEQARAEADIDLAQQLGDSVDLAWALMWGIADGEELTDERRQQLRTVESIIRASVQTDPRAAGGFVLAARQVVAGAAARGVPLHVRALRGSADDRPLPADFIDSLIAMLVTESDAGASIHVFFDGYDDYLALTLRATASRRAGFEPGWATDLACCAIEVSYVADDEGPDAEVTLMVSRPSVVAPPAVVVG